MPVPAYIDDGSFATALQTNADEFSLPFFREGDAVSFELKRRFRVAATAYKRPTMMQTINVPNKGRAFLVETSDATEVANGILQFENTYASLPQKRIVGTSIAYPYQFLRSQLSFSQGFGPEAGDVVSPEVVEWVLPITAQITYEYFLEIPETIIAPKVQVIAGVVVRYGGWGPMVPNQLYPAFDSEVTQYKGKMYQRATVYFRAPVYILG